MASKPRDVTESELSVLQVLWNQAPSTIREVTTVLKPRDQDAYYATVKKLLERLEAKGFVRREPRGIAYVYETTVSRDELIGRRLREVADRLCEGSVTPLLTQLAQHERLTKKQQEALLELISELASSKTKPAQSQGKRK